MAKDPYAFVKKTGRDKYWKTQDNELLALMDPATGELKAEYCKQINCVVCGGKKHNLAFKKGGFRFVKCCSCGFLFVNPQLDESRVIKSYSSDESHLKWVDVLLSPAQIEYDTKVRFGAAVKKLEKLYPKKKRGKILDVGCSIGLFLDLMRKKGWQPRGMEINPKAVKHAREHYKLEVDEKLLHEVDYKKKDYQIISMWGVLEHLTAPDVVLGQVHPLLSDDGTLVILVPNGHSLATRIMHDVSPTFGGRNHLSYFTPKTIAKLLDRCGFKVTHQYTQLTQFDELMHFLRYNNPYLPGEKVEFEEFEIPAKLRKQIENFVIKNDLGYKLIIFAKKK